ncbi:lichenicidin A2 family type 2 lantibiotic, partial [Enterococcus faecalis]|uniref:lichenicidin A2 family type 2 lantibiotic n=1 Tax=Enterococcus faecalis TaxID=1351 RepID=UPI003D6B1883
NEENYYTYKLELVGPSFEKSSLEEMEEIQGSGDVQAETTAACFTIGLGVGALISAKFC